MDWSLAGVVRKHGRERPDRPALTFEDRVTTWGDLDATSSRVAQALASEGVGTDDRVAILDKNGPEFFEVWFGAAKVGAVLAPINWRLAPQEMRDIINDAEARVLFVGPDYLDHLAVFEDDLVTVKKVVVLG